MSSTLAWWVTWGWIFLRSQCQTSLADHHPSSLAALDCPQEGLIQEVSCSSVLLARKKDSLDCLKLWKLQIFWFLLISKLGIGFGESYLWGDDVSQVFLQQFKLFKSFVLWVQHFNEYKNHRFVLFLKIPSDVSFFADNCRNRRNSDEAVQ